jgi:hypothetical protein
LALGIIRSLQARDFVLPVREVQTVLGHVPDNCGSRRGPDPQRSASDFVIARTRSSDQGEALGRSRPSSARGSWTDSGSGAPPWQPAQPVPEVECCDRLSQLDDPELSLKSARSLTFPHATRTPSPWTTSTECRNDSSETRDWTAQGKTTRREFSTMHWHV